MRKATIKDVARHAGVAPSSISRVLNGHPFVTEALRQRVFAAVEALDYRPSSVARSLRVRRTQLVGMLVRDMVNPNFAVICEAAEAAAQERGYSLLVCNSNRSSAQERRYIELLSQRRVDGLVVFVADERVDNVAALLAQGTPVVVVDSALDTPASQVRSDGEQGGYLAMRHLLDLGHQRVAVLAYPQELLVGRMRMRGVRRALEERGLKLAPSLVRGCEPTAESAELAALDVLAHEQPTALVATSVQLTTGALRAVRRRGLRLPDALSFVGFDETETTRLNVPPITVVVRDVAELGRRAVKVLLDQLDQPDNEAAVEVLPFRLAVGGSTRALTVSDGGR